MTPLLEAFVSVPPRLQAMALRVMAGERIALIGPNGSGKTTLLRALAGIGDTAAASKVKVLGDEPAKARPARRSKLVGFLPACRDVRWPIPVCDVIALGLPTTDCGRVSELLRRLRLDDHAERPIDQLSTGERARALLGRVLANQPHLLLLDEPLSNLDPAWVLRTLALLDEEARHGSGIVVALHDLSLLHRFDRVWVLDHGRLAADLVPQALLATSVFSDVFGVEPQHGGWSLRPEVDRRSSP